MDASKYDLKALCNFLKGKPVQNFLSDLCFADEADFFAQTPSIHPFGELVYQERAGIGYIQKWLTKDNQFIVLIDPRDGMIYDIWENNKS